MRKSPVSATSNAEGSRARVEPIASAPVVVDPPAPAQAVRQFSRQHFGRWRVQLRASRKEPFYATRECLFGMRQTGKCRERNVLMVRTTEEVVFRPPGGDVEGRALRNRVSAQARGRRFILTWFTRALRRGLAYGRVRVASAPFTTWANGSANPKSRKVAWQKEKDVLISFPVTEAKRASGCPRGESLAKRFRDDGRKTRHGPIFLFGFAVTH